MNNFTCEDLDDISQNKYVFCYLSPDTKLQEFFQKEFNQYTKKLKEQYDKEIEILRNKFETIFEPESDTQNTTQNTVEETNQNKNELPPPSTNPGYTEEEQIEGQVV
jgi:lipopolysaccharide export LptBFGC system permease protein LptF